MIVAGIMSGTSADGIDIAVVRITGHAKLPRLHLMVHEHFSYPAAMRHGVLNAMDASNISVSDLARLNVRLGQLYADVIQSTLHRHHKIKLDLIGCHGQTLYHQDQPKRFLGANIRCTWQTGEAAVIAARTGVPVVSDFRPADMAANGRGAPLVPMFDYAALRHRKRGRILLNLGGIANITAIPAAAGLQAVIAFDTGPANVLIDACMQHLYGRRSDIGGRVAASGKILEKQLHKALLHPYFKQKPPKSTGREQFGRKFAIAFLKDCSHAHKKDIIATATALTVFSIADQITRFILKNNSDNFHDLIAAGGGTANPTLMHMLRERVKELRLKLTTTDDFGIPTQAKEAMAFALLAYQTWHRLPGNVPSATGAQRAVVLGKVTYI